ncbi:hypothetical protein L1889_00490 [Paenalcaligenes niemegkensis]|nr:hypothetical protein [Paenalcaligenes niemegkensis]MCQ9615383.1 hypothetical protein [Paenalcaligenes niemegkensis]
MYNEDQSLLISKLQRFFVLYYGHEPSANALRDLLDTPDRFAA